MTAEETTESPISPSQAAYRRATNATRRAVRTLGRFADADATRCPAHLRGGRTAEEWVSLPAGSRQYELRHALVRERLPAAAASIALDPPPRVRAYLALRAEERAAIDTGHPAQRSDPVAETREDAGPTDSPAPPAAPVRRIRFSVPAACCGEPVPRDSPRPAIVYCQGSPNRCPSRGA